MLIFSELDMTSDALLNPANFIKAVRAGLSGAAVKIAADVLGDRVALSKMLGVNPSNLSRLYRRKTLGSNESEEILDAMRVFATAKKIFGDAELVREWLFTELPVLNHERPIDLFDTFEGRRWVLQTLQAIEYGEFS